MSAAEAPPLRPAISALAAYVPGRRSTSALVAALASNESHFGPLPSVVAALAAAALRVNRYPDNAVTDLRRVLADGLGVDPAEVAVGPGSAGVLQQIVSSLCDHGDEVVHPWRSFEAYPLLVAIAGATARPVPLLPDGRHDLPAMADAVTGRTRLLLLCSPNNPTGALIGRAELLELLGRVPSRVLVVVDEAYIEFAAGADPDVLGLRRDHPNLCVLRTFSKAHGLAALRVGYAVAAAPVATGIRNTATPFAVSTLAQAAALASLDAREQLDERVHFVVDERERLLAAARRAGWHAPAGHANFVWLPVTPEVRARLLDALTAADILVRSYAAPNEGVRITVADRASNDRVLDVLRDQDPGRAGDIAVAPEDHPRRGDRDDQHR